MEELITFELVPLADELFEYLDTCFGTNDDEMVDHVLEDMEARPSPTARYGCGSM